MLNATLAALGRWLRYHQTLQALNGLDGRLRADLGLTESDILRIAARGAWHDEPVDIFALAREKGEKSPDADAPVTRPAQTPCADKAGSRRHCPV